MKGHTPNSEGQNTKPKKVAQPLRDGTTEFKSDILPTNQERAASHYDEQASNYLQWVSNVPFTKHYMEQTRLSLAMQPGNRVFDLGCGQGFDLQEIAEAIAPDGLVYGIDNSWEMIKQLQVLYGSNKHIIIKQADGEQLPFADNYFDSGRCIRVLQHLKSPLYVLAEMQRVIKPGGRIVVLDPNWEKLALAPTNWLQDVSEVSEKILQTAQQTIYNPNIPGHLSELCQDRGLEILSSIVFRRKVRRFADANKLYSLRKCGSFLVEKQQISKYHYHRWIDACEKASQEDSFLLTLPIVLTILEVR